MKIKLLAIFLLIMHCSISVAEIWPQQTQPIRSWLKKFKKSKPLSRQKVNAWFKGLKNSTVNYIKSSLPQTKKEWVKVIISEGIAEGILMYFGLQMLVTYKKDKAEDFIEKSKGIQGILFTGTLTEQNKDEVNAEVVQTIQDVIEETGMKGKVEEHYAPGVVGAFSYAKSHIFLPTTMESEEPFAPRTQEELAFLTAHEIGHIKSKDHLKFAAAKIGAPVLTLAITKIFDKATNLIIDRLIKAMKLTENSTGYKILTKFKSGKSRIVRNPIVRYLIAAQIFFAYSRYLEQQADIFAAQHGYTEGGISFLGRMEEKMSLFEKGVDVLHPKPKKRMQYLEKEKGRMHEKKKSE